MENNIFDQDLPGFDHFFPNIEGLDDSSDGISNGASSANHSEENSNDSTDFIRDLIDNKSSRESKSILKGLLERRRSSDESKSILRDILTNGRTYKKPYSILRNLLTKGKSRVCPICREAFICSGNLNTHISLHTEKIPCRCGQCGKVFQHRYSLFHHIQMHEMYIRNKIIENFLIRLDNTNQS